MDERTRSHCWFGAYCCFSAGAIFSVISLLAFFMPSSIATYQPTERYFADFASIQPLFISLKILLFLANLAMIGVVTAFASLVRAKNSGPIIWVSAIAIIGYGIGLYQSVLDITVIPSLVQSYLQGDPYIQKIIQVFGFSNPALYILSMGLPGIWFITVSLLAITNHLIPRGLIVLGVLWGVGGIITAIAHTIVILPLIYLVAMGAIIFAPIWSIWEGIFLLKLANHSEKNN